MYKTCCILSVSLHVKSVPSAQIKGYVGIHIVLLDLYFRLADKGRLIVIGYISGYQSESGLALSKTGRLMPIKVSKANVMESL